MFARDVNWKLGLDWLMAYIAYMQPLVANQFESNNFLFTTPYYSLQYTF